jgi:hypothetical protein
MCTIRPHTTSSGYPAKSGRAIITLFQLIMLRHHLVKLHLVFKVLRLLKYTLSPERCFDAIIFNSPELFL